MKHLTEDLKPNSAAHIKDVFAEGRKIAKQRNGPIVIVFNGVKLRIRKGTNYRRLYQKYHQKLGSPQPFR
jgi:hypothetical protein